ncbi:MAG: DivIVA domain-containing protein [Deltaproteobacteria bacterium]|jgi:cell division initiation protein|nr:DivIVA domain-containing protein [Deltaproteobacteria bacterium]MBW2468408.1 DivIVA domain-containing protein [Deltaproteobacteria bacterium]MBW2488839.1 DivIVA domain-containing protein [Deltaproteobacteria bacterium]MBW2516605.1 DivIVA domain-containing protein [Deltaproteobacteria bacterium]
MKITPLDIQQQQFKTRFRGFDIREVDAFLEQMAETFETLQKTNQSLNDEVRRLELEIQGYRKREETFKRALLNSQKVLDQMKDNARKSAELIIAEAEVKAEKILNKAHNRLAQLHEDISELKRQRMQIEVQISSIIEAHSRLLEIGKEGIKESDEEDDKIKFLKKSN